MNNTKSADNGLLVSRTAAWKSFRDALRLYVGRGRRYSVKELARGSGVADRMIESFMAPIDSSDFRKPDLEEQLSIASFIGPEFTTDLLRVIQQGAYWLPDTEDTPPGMMAADATEDAAAIARRAADGVICLEDRKALGPVGRRMMVRGAALAFGCAQ